MAKQPVADAKQGEQLAQQSQSEQGAPNPAPGAGVGEQDKDIITKAEESGLQDQQSDIAPVADKVIVTLLGPYKNYSKGDVTSFHAEVARHLIKSKLAEPYLAQEQGQE